MASIKSIEYENNVYQFVHDNFDSLNRNLFTVLIGNNGSGKSRLLSHLIKEIWLHEVINKNNLFDSDSFQENDNSDRSFSKIIAITSSPFDKFPTNRLFQRYLRGDSTTNSWSIETKYKYLGLRLRDRDIISSQGQFFKIIDSLLSMSGKSESELERLCKTFYMLGYQPRIVLKYRFRTFNTIGNRILECNSLDEYMEKSASQYSHTNSRRFSEKISESPWDYSELKEILERFSLQVNQVEFELNLENGYLSGGSLDDFKDIQKLREYEIIDFDNLFVWKINNEEAFPFRETSSGERALFLNILGIASEIQDNTLICIDEPEISLHPEWQEKYMNLLMSTFQTYTGCHFIIATHSPLIVSNLLEGNSFILDIDSNKLYSADYYSQRSSDFQLATLFKVPGVRNEYLNKESVNILSTLSKYAALKIDERQKAEQLISLIPFLQDNDPVKELVLIIDKALKKLSK